MDIEITCNTDDATLFDNIERNSRLELPWVKFEAEHDGHAVIVGGGPSLADTLDSIRWRQSIGQKVFALNNSAKYLRRNGIKADYTVICDARPENAEFVGHAEHNLIASQCAPETLDRAQSVGVTLWHPAIEGIDAHLPEYNDDYALIGGGTTVGLSAMCLAYTLGYRKLHLYGYDSCHSEMGGHAYPQPLNANDQMAEVTVAGRTFSASLAMARQAELFPYVSGNLIDAGCVITVDGDGLIPWIARQTSLPQPELSECDKYRQMWNIREYREVSPGEQAAATFIDVVKPEDGATVADFGCGTGRGSLAIVERAEINPFLIDFTDNSRDADAIGLPFLQWDLTKPLPIKADYGFCCDVMEHIPPKDVESVIRNVMNCAMRVFFQISLVPDQMGNFIGQKLHLTVATYEWWLELFHSLGYSVVWSKDEGTSAMFYVQLLGE